jgi:CBS domain-containing protein
LRNSLATNACRGHALDAAAAEVFPMKAREIMTRHPATVSVDADLAAAAKVMWDHNCGFVPVLDDEARVCGVLTDRDVCMGAFTQNRPLGAIPVTTSMSRFVAAAHVDDDLATMERSMRDHRVRRLPVVDDAHRLVGVVSLDDLARVALEPDAPGQHEFREDVARTLALVSLPEPFVALQRICGVGS